MRLVGRFVWTGSLALLALALAGDGSASPAQVLNARASCDAESVCSFSAAVKHPDIGWSHYADRWEVLGPNGAPIATRVLRHPHVHQQPFTRSLEGVEVPADVKVVTIRARCSVDGFGGREAKLELVRKAARPAKDDKAAPIAGAEGETKPESGAK
jgi:hypothetical protein